MATRSSSTAVSAAGGRQTCCATDGYLVTVVDGYDYIDLRGEVEIDDDPERGQAVIAALAHRYLPDAESAAASIAGFAQQRRVTFRLRPAKIFERLSSG